MTQPSRDPARIAPKSNEWVKIVLMGSLLAAFIYLAVFYQPRVDTIDSGSPRIYEEATPVPEISNEILAKALDEKRSNRLVTEVEPLEHLLEQSLLVTPAVARKLGRKETPASAAGLRRNSGTHRGEFLWFKGQLEYVSEPNTAHPVPNYDYYDARIRTSDDDQVLFTFSVAPSEEIKIGDWVRVEGFFMKLRDAHFPVPLDRVPMLVGPELFPAYADWEAVAHLDPTVLARVEDGDWIISNDFANNPDMEKVLSESQDVPLWHLASYAMSRRDTTTADDWLKIPAFVTKEQFEDYREGNTPKGTPMRILGSFVQGRILPARDNPLGLDTWSEAWIQVRDLGGKTIPVWIPGSIAESWRRNKAAVCNGYFYKRYQYTSLEGDVRWTPLFVAASLDEFQLPDSPLNMLVNMTFTCVVVGVGLLLFFLARRDRKQRKVHESALLERRRQRRAKHEQPCPS